MSESPQQIEKKFFCRFEIGDVVYDKTDPDNVPWMILKYVVDKRDVIYQCHSALEGSAEFYGHQLSREMSDWED